MKKVSVLRAIFCLLLCIGSISAQEKAANFAGSWELDVVKSKLPERMRLESGEMTVTQTDKELTVATDFKRASPPNTLAQMNENGGMRPDGNRAMRRGGGGMGRGAMTGGGNGTFTYNLDGSETTAESETPAGGEPSSVTLNAKTEKDGKLKLSSSRRISNQTGDLRITTKETWELAGDGKTLKVTRQTETPRGSQTVELFFTKKDTVRTVGERVAGGYQGTVIEASGSSTTNQTPKSISKGVLNGSAITLTAPDYPPAARAVRASGAVNVQVTLDERGNVVSATAVSGHPLLRAASVEAARSSKFPPTTLDGVPVRVAGIIVYNFVP